MPPPSPPSDRSDDAPSRAGHVTSPMIASSKKSRLITFSNFELIRFKNCRRGVLIPDDLCSMCSDKSIYLLPSHKRMEWSAFKSARMSNGFCSRTSDDLRSPSFGIFTSWSVMTNLENLVWKNLPDSWKSFTFVYNTTKEGGIRTYIERLR